MGINNDTGEFCSCPFFVESVFGEERTLVWDEEDGSVKCSGYYVRFCPFCGNNVPANIEKIERWSLKEESSIETKFIGECRSTLENFLRSGKKAFWAGPDVITVRDLISNCEIDFAVDKNDTIYAVNFRFAGIIYKG